MLIFLRQKTIIIYIVPLTKLNCKYQYCPIELLKMHFPIANLVKSQIAKMPCKNLKSCCKNNDLFKLKKNIARRDATRHGFTNTGCKCNLFYSENN